MSSHSSSIRYPLRSRSGGTSGDGDASRSISVSRSRSRSRSGSGGGSIISATNRDTDCYEAEVVGHSCPSTSATTTHSDSSWSSSSSATTSSTSAGVAATDTIYDYSPVPQSYNNNKENSKGASNMYNGCFTAFKGLLSYIISRDAKHLSYYSFPTNCPTLLLRIVLFAVVVSVVLYSKELSNLGTNRLMLRGQVASYKDLVVTILPQPLLQVAGSVPHTTTAPGTTSTTTTTTATAGAGAFNNDIAARVAVFAMSLRRFSSADAVIFVEEPVHDMIYTIAERAKVDIIPYNLSNIPGGHIPGSMHTSTILLHLFGSYYTTVEQGKYSRRVWLVPSATSALVQSDPFAELPRDPQSVHVFASMEHKWDENEIRECFGLDLVSALRSPRAMTIHGAVASSMDLALRLHSTIVDVYSREPVPLSSYNTMTKSSFRASRDPLNAINVSSCTYPLTDLMVQSAVVSKRIRSRYWPIGTGPLLDMSESTYSITSPDIVSVAKRHTGSRDTGSASTSTIASSDSATISTTITTISTSGSNEVRSVDDHLPAIVLNYDRNAALATAVIAQYSFWNVSHISQWNFDTGGECRWYDLAPNRDMFRGRCYVASAKLVRDSVSDCCHECVSHPLCYGFTYRKRSCVLRHRCDEPKLFAEYSGGVSGLVKLQYMK